MKQYLMNALDAPLAGLTSCTHGIWLVCVDKPMDVFASQTTQHDFCCLATLLNWAAVAVMR